MQVFLKEKCSFQKICFYKHETEPNKEDDIIAEQKELNNLKFEISLLKRENNDKINTLANKLLIEDLNYANKQLALKEASISSVEENNEMAAERLKKLEDKNNVKITSLCNEV